MLKTILLNVENKKDELQEFQIDKKAIEILQELNDILDLPDDIFQEINILDNYIKYLENELKQIQKDKKLSFLNSYIENRIKDIKNVIEYLKDKI